MSKYLAPSEDFSKGTAYMATFHSDHFGFKPERVKQFTLSLRFSQAKTKGSFGATNTVKTKESNIKNIQSTLQAKNINIDSDSVKLVASTIKAKEAQITSQVMELITKKDSKFYSYFSDKSGGMTRTLHNKGSIKEALKEAKIQVDDKLIFNQKDISNKLDSKNLIKTLSSQGNYTTEQIKLIKEVVNNKEWDDKTKSLSGVGGIVVAVVVSIVTAGAGAALVGAATTQAVQAAVVQSLVTGVTNQVATAALTGNSFKLDTKALVKGAVSAGVASYVNPAIYNQMGINSDSMDISDLAGRTVVDTTTQTAVSGGSFKDNLVKNSVNNLGAKVSNQIGGAYKDGELNYATHKLAHAATGAISAKLLGEDAASGALGAVTGEVIGEAVGNEMIKDGVLSGDEIDVLRLTTQFSTLITAKLADKDVNSAINSSNIAVENNMIPYLIGATIGAGANLYSQYKRNDDSLSWQQLDAKELIINTSTGAWSGGAKTILGAVARGGLAAGTNESYNQATHKNIFNIDKVINAIKQGAMTGAFIGGSGYIGNQIIRKSEQIGRPLTTGSKTYKLPAETTAGIAGAVTPQISKEQEKNND